MANLELIDPGIDTKHRSHLVGERLPPALRLRTHDECWPLDQRWIPRLRASGLLPLCRLVEPTRPGSFRFPVDRALLSALVDRWRPETHSFHLPVGEMTVTLQDVSMLLGLPIKGLAVVSEAVPVDWKQQLLDRFHGVLPLQQPLLEFDDQHGPTKAWLHQFHTHRLAEDAEDETVRRHLEAYLLWLFGWVLFSSSHHSSVDKHLIFYAQQIADAPLDNIPQFSWGSAVLSGTYRAMCDACTRRSKTATLAGCPLLVMLWCFERFDIGRPVLSSYEEYEAGMYHIGEDGEYDMVDAPTMGFLWTKRNPSWATDTGRLMYPAFVAAFDQLMPDRVRWTPYSPEEVARRTSRGLSILCSRDSELWYTKKCILFDIFVEPYWPERVWRQFGRQQHFPVPRLQLLHNDHMMTRKGQGLDSEAHWASKMAPWAEAWTAARTDVHGPSPPYDDSTYPAYLSWFHGATRWRCVPVPPDREPHVASITDTFATEPSTAFHALTDICNEVGDELTSLVDKIESTPMGVTREELTSALRRLALRAKDGVRRASCMAMGDVPVPPLVVPAIGHNSTPSVSGARDGTSWPGWTPATHGTSPRPEPSSRIPKRNPSKSPAKQGKKARITEDLPNASASTLLPHDPSPSPSSSPSAPPPPLTPPVVEWPDGSALTRDWVAGLESLLDWSSRHLPADRLPEVLPSALVEQLVLAAAAILHREPNLVRVNPGPGQAVVVVGDVHGQLHDVMFLLRDAGFPSEDRVFVFNGDYVDRGAWGLETLLLLLAWKVLLPNCVFLLRGNHESKYCTSVYGFEREVVTKYKDQGPPLYRKFLRCFQDLPLATIIAGCVYTAHGGIFRGAVVLPSKRSKRGRKGRKNKADFTVDLTSMRLGSLDELLKARRNVFDPPWKGQNLIPGDVLWSDPSLEMGLAPNKERGMGLLWGPDITQQFLHTNNLKLIIRSHEGPDARDKRNDLLGMDKGYTIDHDVECGKLITLFSAPDYPQFQVSDERYNNCGAYIVLNPPDYATPVFHSFEAVKPRPSAHPFYDFEEVIDSDEELDLDAMDIDTLSQ